MNSLPAELSEAASFNNVDNTAPTVTNTEAGPILSGTELTEYMLRIRNRRNLALKADQNDPNKQNIRGNWSIDDGVSGNQSGSVRLPFSAGNNRGLQNYSQHVNSNAEKYGINNAGRQFKESSSRDHSRDMAPRSSSHRGATVISNSVVEDREDGEDGEENESGIDHSNQNGLPQAKYSNKLSYPQKADISAVSDSVDDDSVPLEGADEGEVDDEEDEAELLLAALGGR